MPDKKKQMKTGESVRWNEEVSYFDFLRWDICCRNDNQFFKKKNTLEFSTINNRERKRQVALALISPLTNNGTSDIWPCDRWVSGEPWDCDSDSFLFLPL